ncbi:D-amino acid dehydrogenase [Achromobacter insolitus]|jgi:D-amino-acid dehydrogenase|uniref:D-amino acid dehydrogenase n=1 Tax=Achromobacter insolitus TaxID=217204 RepID=A0A6S7F7P9_9BURK|nr:D-amino acid dehydrogenase [Achromobacter insolitus]GLK92796.1 D-amino acid dehydrogenase [Achromobacter xylosoxidans]AXA70871.1 D-amino acid dehydrogenase [Achromobacter insolitus]MDH3063740.1 D-amino acid dehydrogenase [Achromobacter insolitus]NGT16136.1 D-amino acid dehydrogenase [Achromobacter insolitus]QEK92298.1 D-amino acid dehydrogenase [Achromobacter insolitus]
MPRIAIIGAGITGVTSAYALSKLGYHVTVYDRQRYPAMETSYANGGQLSASNAEVWNSTATVMKGLRWLGRHNAPLLLNPRFSWHKYSWLAQFIGQIPNYRRNTIETTRLAIAARQHLYAMAEEEGIDFDLERRGILHIYHDAASFETARRANALLQEGGLERYAVSPEEARNIEPTLTTTCYGGFYTPSDATGDIHKFTSGLARACERRGVRFAQDADIRNISVDGAPYVLDVAREGGTRREQHEADAIVVCAGAVSRQFAKQLGDTVNIYPVKGYSISVHLDDAASQAAAPRVSLLDEAAKIVTSRLGDRFRVAGTAEFNGFNMDIRAERVQPLVDWTRKHFPGVRTSRVVPWCGLRPMTPSMMPRVGPGKRPGVFYNTGHGHLGWTLSAATAQMLAASVQEGVGEA